jgi:murein L,D-transpeptidase YafK
MLLRRAFLALGLALLITTACHTAVGEETKKPVTRVLIQKKDHRMKLLAGDGTEVASYSVAIGPGGMGPKRKEGDMTTPVGRYHITMHQPSQYKIFLRLDYPTADDFKRFNALKAKGDLPASARIGGDIGIHGPPVSVPGPLKGAMKLTDWTAGCIAVDDDEISEVAKLVKDGTVVDIED